MSIASLGSSPAPATVAASSTTASESSDAVSNGFAALLAGAIAPHVPVSSAAPAPKALSDVADDAEAILDGASTDGASTDALTGPTTRKTTADDLLAALGAAAAGLNPVLKTKLARVVERMHSEFGRDVRLVEGVRSQQRQNQLFAQGRETAGPVVTWTRNSQHSVGRAADLMINGGYDDATGFALLRQVAEQEGLHTLGAKDPGHVELRGPAATADTARARTTLNDMKLSADSLLSSDTASVALRRDNLIVATASVGRVATPAVVASVARVATVARVAQVSLGSAAAAARAPESAPSAGKGEGARTPISAPTAKSNSSDGQANTGENSHGTNGDQQDSGLRRAARTTERADRGLGLHGADAYRALDGAREANGLADDARTSVLGDARGTTASRVSRLMDAQDAPGPRSLSHLTLSLDDGNGGQDSVRIGMRGNSIGASFDMSSASSADRVSSRLGELTKALEQRGLEPQSFQVRASSTAREADASRGTTVAPASQRAVADTAAARNDAQSAFGGEARQRFSQQQDQQEQAQRRQDSLRRHGHSFSLTSEDQ